MPPKLTLGYDDFLRETAYDLNYGRDLSFPEIESSERDKRLELLHAVIQTAVRSVLHPLIPGSSPPSSHEWSWSRPVRTLKIRSSVTGTLNSVPTRLGDVLLFESATAIFDSDMVDLDLLMDATEERYTITEFVRETVVKVSGSIGADFGFRTKGVVESLRFSGEVTTITESSRFPHSPHDPM